MKPRDSVAASALLAELPPPPAPTELDSVIGRVLGVRDPVWPGTVRPVDWRDGLGWLYENAEGEDYAFLHYLSRVSEKCAEQRPVQAEELRRWVKQRAEKLPDYYQATLPGVRPHTPARKPVRDINDGPVVAVELRPDRYATDRFIWRIWTWRSGTDTGKPGPEGDPDAGEPLTTLRSTLCEHLREVFRHLDTAQRRARLEVILPVEHFDLGVHLWQPDARSSRPQPEDRLFGVHRQVVLRCPKRDDEHMDAWGRRWRNAVGEGLETLPLTGSPYEEATVDSAADCAVPVLCRSASESTELLRKLIGAGYGLAIWNRQARHAYGCLPDCSKLHSQAEELLRATGRGADLPEELRVLRERISDNDTEAFWADPLALMYDDPRRPVPRRSRRLSSPS